VSVDYIKESELLKALAHPVRLRMVDGLLGNECNVKKMMKVLHLPQSTVSQHLGILKNTGIVQIRKEGVRTCCRIKDKKVSELLKLLGR
jgi:DNA-binding transcriptional ArsR family regulator